MNIKTTAGALALGLCLLQSAGAQVVEHDAVRCPAMPKEEMRPQMELQKQLTQEGWKVRQVKTFNGCYEVYGFDAAGKRVEAFFDPKSFAKVGEVKQPQ